MLHLNVLVVIALGLSVLSCSSPHQNDVDNQIVQLPSAIVGDQFSVVVETSAGEHFSRSYNPQSKLIEPNEADTKDVRYLPLPLNEGFIPHYSSSDSSLVKIPIWLLAQRQRAGTIVIAEPLALLEYSLDDVALESFLMTPATDSLDFYQVENFEDFSIAHDAIKYAFEYWLRHRKGVGSVSRIRWGDEVEAQRQLVEILNK